MSVSKEIKGEAISIRLKSHIAEKAIMCAKAQGFNMSEYARIAITERIARDVKIWRDPASN